MDGSEGETYLVDVDESLWDRSNLMIRDAQARQHNFIVGQGEINTSTVSVRARETVEDVLGIFEESLINK